MKKNSLKSMVFIGLVATSMAITFSSSACKKKTDDPVDQPKTLTKSLLYDKNWYSQGNTYTHRLNSNGTYFSIGTWKWLNNSDTVEVKITSNGDIFRWHFEWSVDHECSAQLIGNSGSTLFKDQQW